jgi:hypothetical protein
MLPWEKRWSEQSTRGGGAPSQKYKIVVYMGIYKTSMGPMLVPKAGTSNPGWAGRAWFAVTPIGVWQAPKDIETWWAGVITRGPNDPGRHRPCSSQSRQTMLLFKASLIPWYIVPIDAGFPSMGGILARSLLGRRPNCGRTEGWISGRKRSRSGYETSLRLTEYVEIRHVVKPYTRTNFSPVRPTPNKFLISNSSKLSPLIY